MGRYFLQELQRLTTGLRQATTRKINDLEMDVVYCAVPPVSYVRRIFVFLKGSRTSIYQYLAWNHKFVASFEKKMPEFEIHDM